MFDIYTVGEKGVSKVDDGMEFMGGMTNKDAKVLFKSMRENGYKEDEYAKGFIRFYAGDRPVLCAIRNGDYWTMRGAEDVFESHAFMKNRR